LLHEAGLTDGVEVKKLGVETNELISIFVSIVKRAKPGPANAA